MVENMTGDEIIAYHSTVVELMKLEAPAHH